MKYNFEMYQYVKGDRVKFRQGTSEYVVTKDVTVKRPDDIVHINRFGMDYLAEASKIMLVSRDDTPDKEKTTMHKRNAILDRHGIKRIIYNDPATIVFFNNGDKQVVKTSENDVFNHREGVMMCIVKHLIGNDENYRAIKNDMFKMIDASKHPVD